MKLESFFIRETIAASEWEQYADQEGFLDTIRNTAARVLAQSILYNASTYTVSHIPPLKHGLGGAMIEHEWKVTVVMPENGAIEHVDQITAAKIEGRREGLHVAAHQLEMTAVRMEQDHGFAATQLRRQAQALRRLADRG